MKNLVKNYWINYLFLFVFIGGITNTTLAQFGQRAFINVVYPNSSTIWTKGQTIDIEWKSNLTSNVRIRLYKGNMAVSPITNSTPNDGLFTYTVPTNLAPGNDYRVRVYTFSGVIVSDFSEYFTVANPPNITVTNPTAGTVWEKGTTQAIQWTDNIPSDVKILLFRGPNLEATLFNSTPSDGSAIYFVPFNLPSANNYRIRIVDVTNATVFGISDFFTITLSPTITVTNPTSNTVWNTGQNQTIQWTSNIDPNANMRINMYNGTTLVAQVANFIPNSGSFTYSVPNSLSSSSSYRLQIYEIGNSASLAYSDFFTINNSSSKRLASPNHQNLNSLEDKSSIQSLVVAPNPQVSGTTSTITMKVDQASTAQLFISDLTGKVVYQKSLQLTEGNNQIDTAPITEKGIYLVSIQTPSTTKSLKLIVQ